jgi:hypothetical protein
VVLVDWFWVDYFTQKCEFMIQIEVRSVEPYRADMFSLCLSFGRADWSGAIIFLIISIVSVVSYFFSKSIEVFLASCFAVIGELNVC